MSCVMVAVPSSTIVKYSTMLDYEGDLGLHPLHVTFQDGGDGKFKSKKSHSENTDLWTYKTKDSFFCYGLVVETDEFIC